MFENSIVCADNINDFMSVRERFDVMSYELNSYVNGNIIKFFLNNPLMDNNSATKLIHNHKYTEFHIVSGGNIKIFIDNKNYDFSAGNVYVIPGGTYHCYIEAELQAQIVAFQTSIDINEFEHHYVPHNIIEEIVSILKKEKYKHDSSGLAALLSFVVSAFFPPVKIKHSRDDATVIYDFISKNYNKKVNMGELSEILHLSDKQTERLVKKYTGYTLKKAIMMYRIKVAEFLERNTDMTETEISEYIGYSNYSGYWKLKKFSTDKK